MSEIFLESLRKSKEDRIKVKIFLKNGFKYEGYVFGVDEEWLELSELRGTKLIRVEDISDVNIIKEGI